ncbi:hypothetical protein V6N12_028191 [Hibiscus sabdariffa]|uniref:Uncharacterized protein n=1 Tax=Hibiscus sabdariffa TaxID=183260 RepID=A0ABR2F532_9ROSI
MVASPQPEIHSKLHQSNGLDDSGKENINPSKSKGKQAFLIRKPHALVLTLGMGQMLTILARGIAPLWVFQIHWSKSGSRNEEGKIRWSTTLASRGLTSEWQQRRRCLAARVCSSSPSALSKEKNETNGTYPPP